MYYRLQNVAEKQNPETRVSAALKVGFRVWQNGLVFPGPEFFKTPVSIPIDNICW